MGMSFLSILMLIVMNGGGGTDLLDYVPTDFYWQQQGVRAVNVDAMVNILEDDDAGNVERLMAIRALGELRDDSAVAVLEPLVDSNEPFVGHYALRSLAWIAGEDAGPAAAVSMELLDADLALVPSDMSMVAQSRGLGQATGPMDLKELLPDMGPAGGPGRDEMIQDLAMQVMELVDQIGNVQLDALTFAMGFHEDQDEPSAVMVVARGQYDRTKLVGLLEETGEMDLFSIEDIEVGQSTSEWGEQVVVMMPNDGRLVFMFTETEGVMLPIDDVAMLIEDGETEPALAGVLLDQLDAIDREQTPVWMAMEVPAMLKQNEPGEFFGAFDAIRFIGEVNDEGDLAVSWVAQGTDAGAVAQTADVIRGYIAEGIMELEESMEYEPEMKAMYEPILGMLRSIELTPEGDTLTGGMTLPGSGGGLLSMFWMGF